MRRDLQSTKLIYQFEELERKHRFESYDNARHPENYMKNRYRDIMPYDSSRVVLQDSLCGDYINASHVSMSIASTGVVNRYIAAQGPLKETAEDFWLMLWEQNSSLVVMVTELEEKGRRKCFQYWPEADAVEFSVYNRITVKFLRETKDDVLFSRDFKLVSLTTLEERVVTQLQFLSWPDHGVPHDAFEFLKLVRRVRQFRSTCPESMPVTVHCSAGVGRTGVLILIETGLGLIDVGEPVYPIELIREMRQQRASFIQTQLQFRFCCETLIKYYYSEKQHCDDIEIRYIDDEEY